MRASNLAGECSVSYEFLRGNFNLRAQHQACVKRRATTSVQMNPACKDVAAQVVEEVFDTCFADTAPFTGIP